MICWFELVKLFQNAGTIDKLEYLFHKIGPQAGQPRGYAFLTFSKREEAVRARKEFDGKSLLGRTLLVKPARSVQKVRVYSLLQTLFIKNRVPFMELLIYFT